jgi:hypothetical protein
MKHDQYWQKPKKARSDAPGGAWWYANEGGIEVHADASIDQRHVTVHIPRRKLIEYLRRVSTTTKQEEL